ncbi:MAG: DUF481 domain-containing protein, partial [Phycisphaerales bacterium]|nr:DUF481 domain-containing protein [Phycisphaerales bacterium]
MVIRRKAESFVLDAFLKGVPATVGTPLLHSPGTLPAVTGLDGFLEGSTRHMRVVPAAAVVVFLVGSPAIGADDPSAVVAWPNGDRLSGALRSNEDGVITLATTSLGEVKVKAAGVTLTVADGEKEDAPAVDGASTGAERPPLGEDEPSEWTGSLSLAATTSRASGTSNNIRLGGELHRKREFEKFDVTAAWYWNQSNGDTSDNDLLVRADQEWLVRDSRWLYFMQGTWQFDQFEEWGHRVSPYAGVGYQIFAQDDLTLTIKGGGGATWRYHNNEVDPQLLFEMSTEWKINDRQSLVGYMSIAPDPLDWGNYLATIQAD